MPAAVAAPAGAPAPVPAPPAAPAAEPLAEWEIALQQEEAARRAADATGNGNGAAPAE